MGFKKAVLLVSIVISFFVGVALGFVRGFEEGYNFSAEAPYPAESRFVDEE